MHINDSRLLHLKRAQHQTLAGSAHVATPRRYKLFLLNWLAIYPLINGAFWLFGDSLNEMPLLLRTFILTGILVFLMTYIVMPRLTNTFHLWLQSR